MPAFFLFAIFDKGKQLDAINATTKCAQLVFAWRSIDKEKYKYMLNKQEPRTDQIIAQNGEK